MQRMQRAWKWLFASGIAACLLAIAAWPVAPPQAMATDLVITAANVAWVSGPAPQLVVVAETVTAGQVLYLDSSVNQYRKAQSNVAGKQVPTALALSAGAANGYVIIAVAGTTVNSGATVVKNTSYFLSGANAGGIAPQADITAGWNTVIVGIAPNTTNLLLTFYASGITN